MCYVICDALLTSGNTDVASATIGRKYIQAQYIQIMHADVLTEKIRMRVWQDVDFNLEKIENSIKI